MGRQNWATPQAFFDKLEAIFGEFTLDVCAEEWSSKCRRYFPEEDDGLSQSWKGQRWFCNPPYGNTGEWTAKALDEAMANRSKGLMLLPNSTDARWFRDSVTQDSLTLKAPGVVVVFVTGRVNFYHPWESGKKGNTRGSMLLLFGDWRQVLSEAEDHGALYRLGERAWMMEAK